ncbi:MAG TPA: LysR substrate-binding domain-containing protein [Nitrospira sp.]|nr:LysR substrate-binding domain-containing protein [Nitrospira sp.]
MELRHLRYFIAVATAKNFTRAAEAMHVSQPSLSVQIRDLEEELGARLFDRLGRSIALTQAGLVFLEHAERAIRELERGAQVVGEVHGAQRGRLAVGTLATVNSYLIPPVVSRFKQRFPGVHLQVHSQPSMDIVDGLVGDRLDLGLCLLPVSREQLTTVRLFEERLVLIVPKRYPLTQSRLRMRDLGGLPLVLMPTDYCLRKMVEVECARAHVSPHVVLEMTSPEGILQAVEGGAGLSILPELYVRCRQRGPDVRVIDLHEPVPQHSVGLVYKTNRYQNLAAREFGLLCRTIMDEMPAGRLSPGIHPPVLKAGARKQRAS